MLTGLSLGLSLFFLPPSPPPKQKQHQSNQNGNVRHEWGPSPPPPPPPARNSADFFLSMLEGGAPPFLSQNGSFHYQTERSRRREIQHSNNKDSEDSCQHPDYNWTVLCFIVVLLCGFLHAASLMALTATHQVLRNCIPREMRSI